MKTQTPTKKPSKNEGGFTLVETSIAFVVMMVGALAMSSLFVFSVQNNVGGGERTLAMAVAQQQLEQLRSVTYEDATLVAGTNTGNVTNGGRTYTVQRTVEDQTNDDNTAKNLKKITIRVTPHSGGPNWLSTPVVLVSYRSTLAAGSYTVAE